MNASSSNSSHCGWKSVLWGEGEGLFETGWGGKYLFDCGNTRPCTEAFLKVVLEQGIWYVEILAKDGVGLLHTIPQRWCESINSQYAQEWVSKALKLDMLYCLVEIGYHNLTVNTVQPLMFFKMLLSSKPCLTLITAWLTFTVNYTAVYLTWKGNLLNGFYLWCKFSFCCFWIVALGFSSFRTFNFMILGTPLRSLWA